MKRNKTEKWLQAATCGACLIAAWKNAAVVDGTEFSGGSVTGPILTFNEIGAFLLLLAFLLTFVLPRIAGTIAFAASLPCLPLYLYLVAPGPFRSVFKGEYSVPLQANFVWDKWAIAGILASAVLAFILLSKFFNPPPCGCSLKSVFHQQIFTLKSHQL